MQFALLNGKHIRMKQQPFRFKMKIMWETKWSMGQKEEDCATSLHSELKKNYLLINNDSVIK